MAGLSGRLKNTFLPEGAVGYLERLGLRLLGLVLFGFALLLSVALSSYRPQDASLNTATDSAVANTLGFAGSVSADLLLQTLGLASVLPVLCLAVWGARLMAAQAVPAFLLRVLTAPAASVLIAVGIAVLPKSWFWPLTARAGGFAGGILLERAAEWINRLGAPGDWRWAVATPSALIGVFALVFALGVAWSELRSLLRGAVTAAHVGAVVTRAALRLIRPATPVVRRTPVLEAAPSDRGPGIAGDPLPETAPDDDDSGQDDQSPEVPAADGDAAARREMPRDLVAPRLRPAPSKKELQARQGSLPLQRPPGEPGGHDLPPLELLELPPPALRSLKVNEESLTQNARVLESVLKDFGVLGRIVKVRPGPVVTLYELEPAPGTKTSRVIGLADDIARSMSALAVRIAVVPGQSVIGIELPNARRETVYLHEMMASSGFDSGAGRLMLALGKDIGGGPVYVDLARMPHLLIAGTTGSGKSVAINTMILSLLYRLVPADCRLIMIDPKMLELSVYDGIPHLLAPVVTDPGKAVVALKWAVKEMENRYRAMSQLGVRNIAGYNQRVAEARTTGQTLNRTVQTGFDPETGKPMYEEQEFALDPLPFIVVVVDEMADLMLVAGKEVEAAIQRLAQMARAAGIHIVMATQRPSVDVITGTIKANFPTRISFQVTSKIDSRTILGEQGAEQLLGQGDMLYMAAGGRITRVHGPFVSDGEVEAVVKHLRAQGEPSYVHSVTEEDADDDGGSDGGSRSDAENTLYDQAVAIVTRERKVSTSFIQRQLKIGYNRAADLVDRMESEGVVSGANHVGKREVLAPPPR